MKKIARITFLLMGITFLELFSGYACTNFIVTKGASSTGSAYLFYSCDGEFLYKLRLKPAKTFGADEYITFGSNKIKQVQQTYSVVGNHINEYQLAIGETTFTGREELISTKNFLDYWDLIGLTLQRSKTAREAIKVMTDLVEEYGYASEGESFSIVDPNEAWILEMIGNGSNGKGANWVAIRIPDGMVAAHANHARIGTFPLNDPENCLYSKGVINFAIEKGYYNPKLGKPFEFNNAYDPANAEKLKYSETRVWSLFRRVAPSLNLSFDFHRGLTDIPYPLYIKPDKTLSTLDVFGLVRDHYEGTPFDMTQGLAAGPYNTPQRNRPLPFYVDSVKHSWERPISTYNASFSFVAQLRSGLSREVGGLLWFGFDDSYFTCYTPLYCSINKLPESFGKGEENKFSRESAWWVFNFVSNYSNLIYRDMVKDMQNVQFGLENGFVQRQDSVENIAIDLLKSDKGKAIQFLTETSVGAGNKVIKQWQDLGDLLIAKYNDGYIRDSKGDTKNNGYPKEWYRRVVNDEPEKYKIKDASKENQVKSL
ncbi:MAG: hypothetical protein EHM93_00350 [Bacteroidales bacterium]|nr:MAG: hypothetical protein EHM93_00350 [Bacteroidales bacterium]